MAVDHKYNKRKPSFPVIELDLRASRGVYETRHVCFVHAGPPCGTASRASVKFCCLTSGYICQLRSAAHPMDLSLSDAERLLPPTFA